MRWQNLTLDEHESAQLPGYRDPAVVRRFRAPEALETRFYEVQAKSILNKVPEASRMPFRWTINPYRGCSHACSFCAAGDTRVLMVDGRVREMRDIKVGDSVCGTVREGRYRRLVATPVEAKWSSIKPAYLVRLGDGTELTLSGDHRLLSDRGWKHVTGRMAGPGQRPYLTLNNKLLGTGGDGVAPDHDSDYRRGYLCGMVRGDGSLASYTYSGRRPSPETHHRFRLALADQEGLLRTREFLEAESIGVSEFRFSAATAAHREGRAIRTQSRTQVDGIRELVAWPPQPSPSWFKGFLAGIFDAEGSYGRGILRIANTDPELIARIRTAFGTLGFESVVEDRGLANGLKTVRLRGGMHEALRFFITTDPAITRKRSLLGIRVKNSADLRVKEIRPLGMAMRMYDITTGTGDFIANGVISHNCFARPTHKYLDFDAGRDFEREIVVKVNAPERLRAELARPSWQGEHVALGTNTDPYQWVEGRYKLMVGIWEAMRDAGNPCSVLTKSPLLLRDLDLMKQIAARTTFTAALSIPTIDERAWRASEPHTPNPRARLEAIAELARAGIPTGVLIAPLMPGINDQPEQVERILNAAVHAGASSVSGIALHLRGEVRQVFMDWLKGYRPDLVPRYEQLYARGAYAPPEERKRLAALVRGAPRGNSQRWGMRKAGHPGPRPAVNRPEAPADGQERLFDG